MSSCNVDDRLTRLPEEIRSHILSLIPTKYALQTSILSTRWRYNWTLVTNLDFTCNFNHELESFTKLVDRVLKFSRTSQLNLFRLNLNYVDMVPESTVSSWFDEAVRLNVRDLDMHVNLHDLPLSILTCKTLTKLRLVRNLYGQSFWECPCDVSLPCLKTLDIEVDTNPIVNAFKLIGGCPILETLLLEISQHNGTEDYIFNIPTLKRLELTLALPRAPPINTVVLSVPKLEYLFVGGLLCSHFVMKDVSSLVEASLSFWDIVSSSLWIKLLKGICTVKFLSNAHNQITDEFSISYTSTLPVFTNMKHLKFKGSCKSGVISRFLECSPELKHLCIEKVIDVNFKDPGFPSSIEPRSVPTCLLINLTTIEFNRFEGEKCDIHLMKYILMNAEVLKKVTIIWGTFYIENIEKQMKVCAELLQVPRASKYCEMRFLGTTVYVDLRLVK